MDIFLVDDDPAFLNLLKKYLSHDFNITTYENLKDAKEGLQEDVSSSIFILDYDLPDGNGNDFCNEIRQKFGPRPYIIILTSDSDLQKKLVAYQFGADDYLVKTVEPLELAAKLNSVANRLMNSDEAHEEFIYHNVQFDSSKMQAFDINNGEKKTLNLTPKEFLILKLLVQNEENLYSREKILGQVWGDDVTVTDRTVDQHITHIRRKLNNPSFSIEAVRGEGYRLTYRK